jgi:hypothetical protein
MTTRQMLMKEVDILDFDNYHLKDLIKTLTDLLAEHGDEALVSKVQKHYEDGWYIALMKPTLETDEEFASRLRRVAHNRQMAEVREREEYKRLTAKFGQVRYPRK